MTSQAPHGWTGSRLRRDFVTPELISGTVLVSVVIAVADEADGILDVFSITLVSVIILWATDVYVYTVSTQRRRADGEPVKLRDSFRHALHKSRGLLFAGVPPLVFLFFGLLGLNEGETAYWVALWAEVVILAVVGWVAFGGRGITWYGRLLGALGTAVFGVLAILLKILIH